MKHDILLAGSDTLTIDDAETLCSSHRDSVRRKLASNPSCPASVLFKLLFDRNVEVRASLGLNPSAEDFVLDSLCLDKSMTVRFHMAGNAKLGAQRLNLLMLDKNPYIAERAYLTNEIRILEEQVAHIKPSKSDAKPLLGQLLVAAGLLSNSDLQTALTFAAKYSRTLGNVLVAKKILQRKDVVAALIVQGQIAACKLSFREGAFCLGKKSGLYESLSFCSEKHTQKLYYFHI